MSLSLRWHRHFFKRPNGVSATVGLFLESALDAKWPHNCHKRSDGCLQGDVGFLCLDSNSVATLGWCLVGTFSLRTTKGWRVDVTLFFFGLKSAPLKMFYATPTTLLTNLLTHGKAAQLILLSEHARFLIFALVLDRNRVPHLHSAFLAPIRLPVKLACRSPMHTSMGAAFPRTQRLGGSRI